VVTIDITTVKASIPSFAELQIAIANKKSDGELTGLKRWRIKSS
jgi:hypothetical protein